MAELTLISWNVNGLRAAVKNGFGNFLREYQPDILGLQEIKMDLAARAKQEFDFADYEEFWHPAKRPGYSGTAVLTKIKPLSDESDDGGEGRLQVLEFDSFYFLNVYFPNANHELSRLAYKQDFNREFLDRVKKLEQSKPVIVCGDFNVAREEIDLARPKENVGQAGFTTEERRWADKFVQHGLVDTFRLINQNRIQYSWWSYRNYARDRNVGWRIDYFLVSSTLAPRVTNAFILDEILGSDHCPVGIKIKI